jgi:phenylpyruvate tautomerase PptA (4-oxalocrotonate tautomerase family)
MPLVEVNLFKDELTPEQTRVLIQNPSSPQSKRSEAS